MPEGIADALAVAGVPDCPTWLDDDAREEWIRLLPDVAVRITRLDRAVFAAYCSTWSLWKKATEAAQQEDIGVFTGKGMYRLNPHAAHAAELTKQLKSLADALGFTPASRGVKATPVNPGRDELDDFIKTPSAASTAE